MARMYKREREETLDLDGYYPTGDRGYIENGWAFFAGRYSETIKSLGANVSPTEVEAVISLFPEVENVVVYGAKDPDRGEVVAAAVELRVGCILTGSEVQQRCRLELSTFKVPRVVRLLATGSLPMLPTGKPDRRAVRDGRYQALPDGPAVLDPRLNEQDVTK